MLTDKDRNQMEKTDKEIKEKESQLNRLVSEAQRQKKRRDAIKSKLTLAAISDTDMERFSRTTSGRPRLEELHPDLLSVIKEIASAGN